MFQHPLHGCAKFSAINLNDYAIIKIKIKNAKFLSNQAFKFAIKRANLRNIALNFNHPVNIHFCDPGLRNRRSNH